MMNFQVLGFYDNQAKLFKADGKDWVGVGEHLPFSTKCGFQFHTVNYDF